jgi:hypothetical protein
MNRLAPKMVRRRFIEALGHAIHATLSAHRWWEWR